MSLIGAEGNGFSIQPIKALEFITKERDADVRFTKGKLPHSEMTHNYMILQLYHHYALGKDNNKIFGVWRYLIPL